MTRAAGSSTGDGSSMRAGRVDGGRLGGGVEGRPAGGRGVAIGEEGIGRGGRAYPVPPSEVAGRNRAGAIRVPSALPARPMKVTASPTPNPNSLKFEVPGRSVIEEGLFAFHSAREAEDHPLGAALFSLPGVHSLLMVPQFVTVTKHPAADWNLLAEGVERVLADHLGG